MLGRPDMAFAHLKLNVSKLTKVEVMVCRVYWYSLNLLKVWLLGSSLMRKRSGIRRIILFGSTNELFEYGGYLLNEPRQTHEQRQRHDMLYQCGKGQTTLE